MPRKAIDYNKIIIYKLVRNNDYNNENIYVGSTTDFIKRKNCHKTCCCNENSRGYNFKVYQNIRANGGWENWTMIEIEKFPCVDKREAQSREEYWRCEFNARLNMIRAFRTEEQRKEQNNQHQNKYRTENPDKMKEYHTTNADKIKEYQKNYRTANADKIKEQNKKYHIEHAEEMKQYNKEYRTENAEKLHQKYNCDCGSVYIHTDKSRHFKSKKHQNYIKNKIEMNI